MNQALDNKWIFIDFQPLLDSILNGETSVQEPITIYNQTRSQSNNISFLTHLLNYENITKDNLLENLSKIHGFFINKINQLKDSPIIIQLIEQLNNEWYRETEGIDITSPIHSDFFKLDKELINDFNKACQDCSSSLIDSEKRKSYPIDHPVEDDSIDKLDNSISLCNVVLNKIDIHLKEIEKMIYFFKNFDLSLFIDLSIKHRPIYIQFNTSNESGMDDDVPDNIHRIFSNYIYIHNLLYKQIIQHYNYIKSLIDQLNKILGEIKDRKGNIQLLANYDSRNDNIIGKQFNIGDTVIYKDTSDYIGIITNIKENDLGDSIISLTLENGKIIDTSLENIYPFVSKDNNSDDSDGSDDSDDSDAEQFIQASNNVVDQKEKANIISTKFIQSSFF